MLTLVEGRRGLCQRWRRGAYDCGRAHRGAVVQSLSEFGFAPLLAATVGGPEAVSTITGTSCNVAVLAVLNDLRAGTP